MSRRPHHTLPIRPVRPTRTGRDYVGIDNGTSGSVGIIGSRTDFFVMPTFSELSYTKEKKNITRIDTTTLKKRLEGLHNPIVLFERPMVNPGRFAATLSAMRALEATLIVIEQLGYARMYIDSKGWQSEMLPNGIKGSDALKLASKDIGKRLFPQFKDAYKKDADSILIAEWARRGNL
jgi:hypothetical protein